MGLAIVKKFVEMHGGTVQVKSRLPRGTSFVVEIPGSS
jgi:signal transduction histidine kinase